MEIELYPCAFCKGPAYFRSRMILGSEWFQVKCRWCFARTYHETTMEKAAEAWNERAE